MKLFLGIIFLVLLFFSVIPPTNAQQGCCSYHQGVCGSSCCDGTPLSAKCGGGYAPIQTYRSNLNTPIYTQSTNYCGAGDWYDNEGDASESLVRYESSIREPLEEKLRVIDVNYNRLLLQMWGALIFFCVLLIYLYRIGNDKVKETLSLLLVLSIFLGLGLLLWPGIFSN